MSDKITPTPTAEKMLSIISGRLHIKREALKPDATWRQLNVTEAEKESLLVYIAQRFSIPIGHGIQVGLNNGKGQIIKASWQNQIKNIKTIWNVLQFIESNDDVNGRASAYNL